MKRRQEEKEEEAKKLRLDRGDLSVTVDVGEYSGLPFPTFAKPTEVGCISIYGGAGADGPEMRFDRSLLKMYSPPENLRNLRLDLNDGYDTFISRDDLTEKEYLNPLLKWIVHERNSASTSQTPPPSLKTVARGADFVCWRGLLTKICNTPYENREDWKIAVVRFEDVYFLCEMDTKHKVEQILKRSERDKLMTYWGYRFEKYIVKDDEGSSTVDPCRPVDNHENFTSVVRTKLGKKSHRLLFGGEVDGLNPETGKYIELKTTRQFTHPRQRGNFYRFKALKYWIQSFLIGIDEVVVGFRDDDGFVREIQILPLRDMTKEAGNQWSAAVCMNFLERILDALRLKITENNPEKVFLLEWNPGQRLVNFSEHQRRAELKFLPDWFLEEFR